MNKTNDKNVGAAICRPHFEEITKKQNGITLIALIITIVLMLILAGVAITVGFGEGGLLGGTSEAKYKTELKQAIEKYEYFVHKKEREDVQFETSSLMIGKNGIAYNTKILGESGNIYTVLSEIPKEYADCLEVIKGELYYSNDNAKKEKWARELGLKINPYKIVDGTLLSANENLALADQDTSTLVIPNSVTSIGEGAFADIEGLKTIIIPSNVREIQKNAFNGNTTLENVIFETEMVDGEEIGVTTIGQSAFYNCTKLASISIPNTVTEIGSSAFFGCTSLESVELSENITKIGSYTLYTCSSLKNIIIPEKVTYIGLGALSNCRKLEKIYISKNVSTIETEAFSACVSLIDIEIDSENQNFAFQDGILFNVDKTKMIYILETTIGSTQTTFTIPSTVTTLGAGLIGGFKQLTKIIIPASVTSIDNSFFTTSITEIEIDSNNPKYLSDAGRIYSKDKKTLYLHFLNTTDVELEEGIEIIETYAFRLCGDLQNITLPDSLITIKNHAFNGRINLTSINIGKNVSTIQPLSFYGSGLTEIIIDSDNNYYISEGTAIYSKDKTIFVCLVERLTEFEIPEGVQRISNYAFHGQYKLTKIVIPNTVTWIDNSFNNCTSLTKIEIPNSVTTINRSCFANSSVSEIIIDNYHFTDSSKKTPTISGEPWGCKYGARAITWLRGEHP